MTSLLVELFGVDFAIQFIISLSYLFEILTCTLIFNFRTKKRKNFWLWVLFFVFVGLAAVFLLAWLRYLTRDMLLLKNMIHSLFSILFMLIVVFVLYDKTRYEKLLTFCASNAASLMVGRLFSLMLNLCGLNDKVTISFFPEVNAARDWTIYFLIHFALDFLLGLLFYSRSDTIESQKAKRNTILLTIPSVVLTNVLFSLSDPYQSESWTLTILLKLFACIICLLVLVLRAGILLQNRNEEEKNVLHQIFRQEKEQFDNLRLSTEAINAKCHDLRQRLGAIGDKLTNEEMKSLKEATKIYDSTIKTGLDVLDAILYEKQLICRKKGIRLSALCDGKLLSFMESTQVYSLVGNALANAIEATENLPPEKRIIDITLRLERGLILLDVTNYFEGDVHIGEENLPVSSKRDGHNHGYGSKSIRYIVEKYKGSLRYKIHDNIFTLLASFDSLLLEKETPPDKMFEEKEKAS